jgi:hypothetical protein
MITFAHFLVLSQSNLYLFLQIGGIMHGLMENDFMFSGRGEVPWHGIGAVLPFLIFLSL